MLYTVAMRFEVPQFIEIEDKIFGPFTWKQFIYLVGGVGFGVVAFITLPLFFFALLGIPAAVLGALLAFYPVNNRPFSNFLEAFFSYYKSDRLYYWRKKDLPIYKQAELTSTGEQVVSAPEANSSGINSLARKLELEAIQKDT